MTCSVCLLLPIGTRKRFDAGASVHARKSLVAALKNAHEDLCTPPEMMKEENKSRWRPRVRTDIEWDSLINVPEAEELRKAEVRARRDVSTRHPVLSSRTTGSASSIIPSIEELSKAEAKKLRRLQRQEDLESKSRKQTAKAAVTAGQKERNHDDDHLQEDASESEGADEGEGEETEHHEQPPYLSIGLIGQPKSVFAIVFITSTHRWQNHLPPVTARSELGLI